MREAFERIAGGLTLSAENVLVIGSSRSRYREAVAFLEASSHFEEADLICRLQGDHALEAANEEKRGDMKNAARSYALDRDYGSALRCYTAIGDERGMARMLERQGKIEEAIALWEKLGKPKEVQRLLRRV